LRNRWPGAEQSCLSMISGRRDRVLHGFEYV
jgi:hypothetical protein